MSFLVECEVLRNIRHSNLAKILTACSNVDYQGNEFKELVYKFMPNKSVDVDVFLLGGESLPFFSVESWLSVLIVLARKDYRG